MPYVPLGSEGPYTCDSCGKEHHVVVYCQKSGCQENGYAHAPCHEHLGAAD